MSLRLKSLRPALIFRPAGRPIVLPAALPTVPRVAALGSRTPATFSADRLVVLLVPIVRPIRELDFTVRERRSVADCFFVAGTEGVLLPITVPMFRLRWVRSNDRLLFTLDEIEGLVELTAGCLATVGADELRVPIELPIRERWLVVGCFLAFEGDGVLRLLEPPIREAPLERAAGCSALLETDGLVVVIVLRKESLGLPIRDVMLGLIRLLVLLLGVRLVIDLLDMLLLGARLVMDLLDVLLDGVLVLIELPIREDMLELILPFELLRLDVLVLGVRLVMALLDMLLLGALLVMDLLDMLLLGVRLVIDLLDMLLLGARLVIDLLDMLLLGARLVMDLLDMLLLGARLVIDLLELLLLGVRLVMDLLELLLLGVRLVVTLLELLLLGVRLDVTRLELRLDETLLELLDDDLDGALGARVGLEAGRLCLLELLDFVLLDCVLAARTGSAISARISTKST